MKVVRGTAKRIPQLQALWEALEVHHAELAEVPSIRPLADSWEMRRQRYEDWLADGSGRLFVAERDGRTIGYVMLTITDAPASWDVGARAGEVETLSVVEEERSSGVGRALLDAALAEADAEGVRAIGVGVVHSNVDGIRFYERAGFKPFYVELLRLADDVRPRDDQGRRRRGLRALLRNRSRQPRDR
ncbi:MAG TPA: GNAT family N-acetyltransferase [Burkholderiaceae bacterium]|nr:GNAT family N-acetyltransferase [Burkholderiaceae bacterium]